MRELIEGTVTVMSREIVVKLGVVKGNFLSEDT